MAGWSPEEFVRAGARRHPARGRGRRRRELPLRQPRRRRRRDPARARRPSTASAPRASPWTAARWCGPRPTSGPAWPPATWPALPRRSATRTPSAGSSSAATSAAASSASRPRTCRPTGSPRSPPTGSTPAGCAASTPARSSRSRSASAPTRRSTACATRRVESYVLDRDDLELYDVEVEVSFVERLRGMVAFESVEALVAQMADDVAAPARSWRPDVAVRRAERGDAEEWFLEHGLPYFVDDVRDRRAPAAQPAPGRARACWSPRWSGPRSASLAGLAGRQGRRVGRLHDRGDRRAGRRHALRAAGAADRVDRALGGRSGARQPRPAGPAGDPGAADAAAVHHVLLHQHRGLAGRGRARAWGVLGGTVLFFGILAAVFFLVARLGEELDDVDDIVEHRGGRRPAAPARRSRTRPATSPRGVPTSPSTRRSSGSRRPTWSWPW